MALGWRIVNVLVVCVCTQAATVSEPYSRRPMQSNTYLPPYSSTNFGDKSHNSASYTTHTTQSTDSYQDGLGNRVTKLYKPLTSYAPPPSGAAAFKYSTPQATSEVSLASLIPKSVLDQLSAPEAIMQQQYQQQPEMVSEPNGRMLMVEEPATMWLTPSQNKTIAAAKLLASTLLEASGEAPLESEPLHGLQLVNPNTLQNPHQLNATDVVIVKSHKKAYIIPPQLARDAHNPMAVRELYALRNRLEKAYTINQFIFIIKPEKINFLNKLV